jgi:hypothetical protein
VIGVQVGTYRPGEPSGMVVEMTYLEPDASPICLKILTKSARFLIVGFPQLTNGQIEWC